MSSRVLTYLLSGSMVELAVQDQRVISVACGAEHSVASVESGEVRLVCCIYCLQEWLFLQKDAVATSRQL